MQPSLLPPNGTIVNGLPGAIGLLGRVAHQASANAVMDVSGPIAAMASGNGIQASVDLPTRLQLFEIRSCWSRRNPPPSAGPSNGLFWWCRAQPVEYFWRKQYHSYFKGMGPEDRIFWTVGPWCGHDPEMVEHSNASSSYSDIGQIGSSSPGSSVINESLGDEADDDGRIIHDCQDLSSSSSSDAKRSDCHKEHDWQRVLYPKFGLGQWVWCVFDYVSDVWRVIDTYDDIVRFKLLEPLSGCGHAKAIVVGYQCGATQSSSSSGSPSSSGPSTGPSSKSSSRPSQPSSSPPSSQSGCRGGFVTSTSHGVTSSSHGRLTSRSSGGWNGSLGSSSSSSGTGCRAGARSRGRITVFDPAEINAVDFTGTAPRSATGWAKRCADANRFEVIKYGKPLCALPSSQSSSSLSSASAPPPSSSPSSSQPPSSKPPSSSKPSSVSRSTQGSSESSRSSSQSSVSSSSVPSSSGSSFCHRVVCDVSFVDCRLHVSYCCIRLHGSAGTITCDCQEGSPASGS